MGMSSVVRSLVVGVAHVAMALVVAANAASAQDKPTFRIGMSSTSFANLAPQIAKELGIFDKHGLNANFIVLDSGNAGTSAVISKSIEFATAGSGEFVAAQTQGQDVIPVVVIYTALSGTIVLSKATVEKLGVSPMAPVRDRLKALDGLIIASPSATGAYTLAPKGALATLGGSIRFTYMAQPAMEAALASGSIQGYMAGAPFWALPIVRGTGVQWISGPKNEVPVENSPANTSYLVATRDYVTKNPDVIKRLKAVFADLSQAIDQRPAEVKAVVAKLTPGIDAATIDLLFNAEAHAWKTRPITAAGMAHELAYVKAGSGVPAERIDKVDPASLLIKD